MGGKKWSEWINIPIHGNNNNVFLTKYVWCSLNVTHTTWITNNFGSHSPEVSRNKF